ncbi:hypothetical protein [Methyloversatilis universalis]|uniref:hypothetical protein n=1 Tax=Methyloversatilis universalis TaxID=378211 RepID=UPI001E485D25|nr:hypothetical protein [Methyloversatilis universalis]
MRTLLLSAVLLAATSVSAEPPVTDWRVLVPGEYHGDEAPARPGPGWLALVPVGGVWRLEPAIVRATRVHDPVLDAEGDRTGIALTSNRSDTLVLLRLPDLQPGKVDTPALKFSGGARLISLGEAPLKLQFRSDEYVIEGRKAGIEVRTGGMRVVLPDLAAARPDSEDAASLLWAGDLDRDGRLDLLFSYSGYNRGGVCLYLSSGAPAGVPVRLAGCHGGVGC